MDNLTTQETDIILKMIQKFKKKLSEKASLDHTGAEVQVHPGPFLSRTLSTFSKAKIKAQPLTIISNKIPELKSIGLKEGVGLGSNQLTVNQTRDLISLIRAHVSFSTELEAGCHILVNVILLHLVSKISDAEVDVSIIPKFRMESTKFDYAATKYGDVVDFMIVKGPPVPIKFLLGGPPGQLAFLDPDMVKLFSSNIYEAERDGLNEAIPQAAMACASYCRHYNLSTFRGCVTNGESWVFFTFNAADSGEGGTVSISDEFHLKEDLSGLPLVLGLLSDWIMNSKKREQQFFEYFKPNNL